MSEGTIRTSSRASGRKRKKKMNQIPIALGVFVIVAVIGVLLTLRSPDLGLFWMTGIAFGFILQRARFCFTASMRDPYLTGSTSITRAVLIAFAITSIAFTAMKYGALTNGQPIPGQSYVAPISIATGVGAFMFGIGMVIAGGCASGTLMRVGEGFLMQLLSLFFFVVGSLWGAHDYGWWYRNFIVTGKRVFLPDVFTNLFNSTAFGWFGGLLCNLLIIAVLYVLAHKWENRKKED